MQSVTWLWWIALLPLVGAAACGVLHLVTLRTRRLDPDAPTPDGLAAFVACGVMAGALILSLRGFLKLRSLEGAERLLESPAWEWMSAGNLSIDVSMLLDPLSSTMTLVVTGVGLLIHVYSIGYMKGDPGYAKFFAFLNLFCFAMLMLVLSSNLLGLFVGWEGVGLCSYLLIGFWYAKGWPAEAAQKAFVVNRIGDACFLVGSFLLVDVFGTLDLADVSRGVMVQVASGGAELELTLAALLLFGGCCGKSAQFPLFTWLPDAMAGPTPVSALIHAATMVTAGIYLIVRLNPLFAASAEVLLLIGSVGALTALIGASTALVQRDIKKVLAYSTVSQLGFMFMALGAGAFGTAIFHLVTHAFFKGLLFLGAGSVIHGMHDEQDMHKMGGLRKHMPRTHLTFVAGAAALSGLPLMSGFFSKDEILATSISLGFAGQWLYLALWAIGIATAAMTAFYTWRMVALVFYGRERFDVAQVHPHESPAVMTVPLAGLAVLSVFGGLLGLPAVLGPHFMHSWLEGVIEPGTALVAARFHSGHVPHPSHAMEWVLLGLGSLVALFFAHLGFHGYREGPGRDEIAKNEKPGLFAFLGNAWGIDTAYFANVVQPTKLAAFVTAVVVDQFAIDGVVNGTATLARGAGQRLRKLTDGRIVTYALWIGGGAVVLAFLWGA